MAKIIPYIYDINLLMIVGLGILLCQYKPSKLKKIIYLVISGLQLTFISGFRYGIGFDYFNYYLMLNNVRKISFMDIFMLKGPAEPGFCVLMKLISYVTNNPVVMHIIIAALISVIIMIFIYLYSSHVWVSVFLYVTIGFYFGTMNLIRQYFAAVIGLFCIKFAQKRKFLPFLLVVLIAASVHKSALILIPTYFVCRLKINWKTLTVYSSLTLLSYIFCIPLINLITQYMYTDYNPQTGKLSWLMKGMPSQFIIIPFIYCLVAVLMKGKLLKRNPGNIVLINYSIYTLFFYILITRYLLIERSSNYFYISIILLGAELLSCLKVDEKVKKKMLEIRKYLADMKKKNIRGKELEVKNHEYKKLSEQYADDKGYYRLTIFMIIILGVISQSFASTYRNHHVFPYCSIFNVERDVDYENSIKHM